MKTHFHPALLVFPILICIGTWQMADAQSSHPTIPETRAVASTEERGVNLERRNLERAQALAAYQGTRTYRLDYHGFPGNRAAEMVVDVNFKSNGAKSATKE